MIFFLPALSARRERRQTTLSLASYRLQSTPRLLPVCPSVQFVSPSLDAVVCGACGMRPTQDLPRPPPPPEGSGVNTPVALSGGAPKVSVMTVILRHAKRGSFYAGPRCWVNDARKALDLKTVEHAVEISRKEELGEVQIVARFDDPYPELVFPLRLNGASKAGIRPAAAAEAACARG